MKVKIKLSGDSKSSLSASVASNMATGLDIISTSMETIDGIDYGYIEYGTGMKIEIPEGYIGYLYPRGSISNTGLILANGVEIIDQHYTREIKMRFKYIPGSPYYKVGDKIGRLIIVPIPYIDLIIEQEEKEELVKAV